MADISAVDSILKVDKLSVSPALKFGGDKKILNVGGDLIITQVYAGTISPQNPDLVVQETKEIISEKTASSKSKSIDLVLSPFLGIVKSLNLKGSRVHLEVSIVNEDNTPIAIKGAYIELNNGTLHFKQFFSINESGFRNPDPDVRFPIIIAAKGAGNLSIEFENLDQQLISRGDLSGELFVLIGNNRVTSQKFELEINLAMENTLNALQKASETNKSPILYDARIKS